MNPVAIVTGASRGIGRGIALKLAELGYDLIINYANNQAGAQDTAISCQALAMSQDRKQRADVFQADISSSKDRQRLITFARNQFGRLDLLVNNAGIAPELRTDMLGASEESFDSMISVNLKGPYFLTQLAARWMVEQVTAPGFTGKKPKIVTITSISAYTASVNRGDYCIAKAGLAMLTPLFAARLAEFGINVYDIRPGIVATDMTSSVKDKYDQLIEQGLTPIHRWGTPEDVAKAVAAIVQELLPFSTGEVINIDGGFHLRRL
jgi:NAD(P)-dependent dehydrogenase (short-subunit alcohol dehydrogenase family)